MALPNSQQPASTTLVQHYVPAQKLESYALHHATISSEDGLMHTQSAVSSTGKGILIGMLSAFGSAAFLALIVAIVYFFRHTTRGRIFLDRIGRPGEFDDEQAFAKEEAEALEQMDDIQKAEYLRAKGGSPEPALQQIVRHCSRLHFADSCLHSIRSSQPT